MDIGVKIMGAVDVTASIVLILHPSVAIQIIGWILLIKGIISLLS